MSIGIMIKIINFSCNVKKTPLSDKDRRLKIRFNFINVIVRTSYPYNHLEYAKITFQNDNI